MNAVWFKLGNTGKTAPEPSPAKKTLGRNFTQAAKLYLGAKPPLPFREKTFLERLGYSAGHGVDVELGVDTPNMLIHRVKT